MGPDDESWGWAAIRCGTNKMQVRLPPIAQAQANQGSLLSLFQALTKKLHQANQEGATDLPHQLPYSGAELWQLDAELLGLSKMESSEKTWGRSGILPALHCFRARMGGTLRLDHVKH